MFTRASKRLQRTVEEQALLIESMRVFIQIIDVVTQENATDIDGSTENTDKDLEAYDVICGLLMKAGLL